MEEPEAEQSAAVVQTAEVADDTAVAVAEPAGSSAVEPAGSSAVELPGSIAAETAGVHLVHRHCSEE